MSRFFLLLDSEDFWIDVVQTSFFGGHSNTAIATGASARQEVRKTGSATSFFSASCKELQNFQTNTHSRR
jgi:hypothetical protein